MKIEERTKQECIPHQQCMGRPGLTVDSDGLFESPANPGFATSCDGLVQDPTNASHPQGLGEMRNPYSMQDKSLKEVCTTFNFYLENQTQQKDGIVQTEAKT